MVDNHQIKNLLIQRILITNLKNHSKITNTNNKNFKMIQYHINNQIMNLKFNLNILNNYFACLIDILIGSGKSIS